MGRTLHWTPQESFTDFFYTTAEEIIKRRTVFKEELTYFVPYGGRGSAKSFTFIDALVIEATYLEKDSEMARRFSHLTAYQAAEMQAFMHKSDEREWISKREHQPVKFRPESLKAVLLKKGSVEAMERELWKLGLNGVEGRKI